MTAGIGESAPGVFCAAALPKQMKDMGMPTSTEMTQKAIQEDGNWVICN